MRVRAVTLLILWFCALLCAPVSGAQASARQEDEPPPPVEFIEGSYVPGELIVGLQPGMARAALQTGDELPRLAADEAASQSDLQALDAVLISVPPGQEEEYRQKLLQDPNIRYVEPNYLVEAHLVPDDPAWPPVDPGWTYGAQYAPTTINADDAWNVTTGSSSITIAIVDSGIDPDHPEFAGRLVAGYDYVDGDTTPEDRTATNQSCGHGTHVAGIAAATGNNAQGIAGVDWQANIMPVRVLGATCSGTQANVAAGIRWAADHGADVINLSLGLVSPSTLLEDATRYAYNLGIPVIASAGNNGGAVMYPAAYPWVLAVGATNSSNGLYSLSCRGAALDLVAPGVGIVSTTPLDLPFYYNTVLGVTAQYGTLSGTSMAAAYVTGAVSLLLANDSSLRGQPDRIYDTLTETALDLGTTGWDSDTGAGLLQLDRALNLPTSAPPAPSIDYEVFGSTRCPSAGLAYHWVEVAPATSDIFLTGDNASTTVDLAALYDPDFSFNFGGRNYTSLTISTNGYITFGGSGASSANGLLPATFQPDQLIAPLWDDLTITTQPVRAEMYGTAPNRYYVIEWYQAHNKVDPLSELTFEVILYETSNRIVFQYNTLLGRNSDGASATIGIEYYVDPFASGSRTLQDYVGKLYSYNQANTLLAGEVIEFDPYPYGEERSLHSCNYASSLAMSTGRGCDDSLPFTAEIPDTWLVQTTTLDIDLLATYAPSTTRYLDLGHYADISLLPHPVGALDPPGAVCYNYTAADVLAGGGRPQNLFIGRYDYASGSWNMLPTEVDAGLGRLIARIDHFSVYGVFARRPGSHTGDGGEDDGGTLNGHSLPTTGGTITPPGLLLPIAAGGALLAVLAARRCARRR